MAAINFPSSPTVGQTHSEAGNTWEWTGSTWDLVCDPLPETTYVGETPISVDVVADPEGNKEVTISHDDSGVTPGTYNKITVDAKGHITAAENVDEQDNFVRVLRIPSYAINFSNDIKDEIAAYISQMDPPLVIDDTDSKWNVVIEYSVPDLLDANTEINVWFDNSGSMDNVIQPLVNALNSCLKSLLLPIYGDSATYDARVRVNTFSPATISINGNNITFTGKSSGSSERTFHVLNTMGSSDEITRVINLVFQDEANSVYHTTPFDGSVTTSYTSDLTALKSILSTKLDVNYYKSVIYHLSSGPSDNNAVAFKAMLQAAVSGSGSFAGSNSITSLVSDGRIAIEYDRQKSNDSNYYLSLIRSTLISMGFTNIGTIESLSCFVPITGTIVTSCTTSTTGTIDVIGVSGGAGGGYYFTLNGGATEYVVGAGAAGIANGTYAVRIYDEDGNNYLLGDAVISCSTPLTGTASSSCTGGTNGSGSIDVTGVSGGSGTGYYFTLNGGTTQYTPGTPVTGLTDGSYAVVLFDSIGASVNLGTQNIACTQTYNINVRLCGTCTIVRTGAVAYNPAFPLIVGKFYILSTGEIAEVTGLSTFAVTDTIPNTFSYYNSCAEAPCP